MARSDSLVEDLLLQQQEVLRTALEKSMSLNLEIAQRLKSGGLEVSQRLNKSASAGLLGRHGAQAPSPREAPEASLLLEFDCGDGSSKSLAFTKANLGMDIRSNRMPMTLTNVKDQAFSLGCRDGWTLTSIGGVSISRMAFEDAYGLLRSKLLELRTRLAERRAQGLAEPLLPKEPPRRITGEDILAAQEQLQEAEYRTEDLYSETGCAQAVARASWFRCASLFVVALNCLWIAYDAEYDNSPTMLQAPLYIQIVSNAFCIYFFLEIVIRLLAFEEKCRAFRDRAFVFDFLLVVLMAWETWIEPLTMVLYPSSSHAGSTEYFRILRLFRLARIARISALIRHAPDLVLLINSMYQAFNAVVAAFVLLLTTVYVFSITFKLLLGISTDGMDEAEISEKQFDKGQFNHIGSAFEYLLSQMMCGPDADMFKTFLAEGFVYYFLYLICVVVGYMTIVNMVIGVLCQVVQDAADDDATARFEHGLDEQIGGLLHELDTDGSGMISKDEFPSLMLNERMLTYLRDLEIDAAGLMNFVNFSLRMNRQSGISVDELLDTIKDFRPGQPATAADIKLLKMSVLQRLEDTSEVMV